MGARSLFTFLLTVLLIAVAFPVQAVDGQADDWQMSGGDTRHSSSTSYGLWYQPNEKVWEVEALSYYEMVCAKDGTIYAALNNNSLLSISSLGKINWCLPLDGWVGGSPAVADDGTVYIIVHSFSSFEQGFELYDGLVQAISPEGEIVHTAVVADMRDASDPVVTNLGDVIVHFESFVRTDSGLMTKDEVIRYDGNLVQRWSYYELREDRWDVGPYESPSVGPDGSATLWFNGTMLHLSINGEKEWTYEPEGYSEPFYASLQKRYPILVHEDGRLFFGFEDYAVCLLPNGTVSWTYHMLSGLAYPVAIDRWTVFFTDEKNLIEISVEGYSHCRYGLGERYATDVVLTENGAVVFACGHYVCFVSSYMGSEVRNISAEAPDGVTSDDWFVINLLVTGNNAICYQTGEGEGKIVMIKFNPDKQATTTSAAMSVQDATLFLLIVVALAVMIFLASHFIPKKSKKH